MRSSLPAKDVPSRQGKSNGTVMVPQCPAAVRWLKSRLSGGGACAEIALTDEHVWIRDSKDPLGPVLGLTAPGWVAFITGLRRGEFDR